MPEPVAPGNAVPFVGDPQAVETASGEIRFHRRGTGDPVLLLHPLALSGAVWTSFTDRLADRYDVIAPDARGHGGSSWDQRPFTVDDLADDVETLLDALSIDTVDVVGMSMGGSTAITFAGTRPARVRRLVLADTTAWYGEQAPAVWSERAARVLATERAEQVPFQVDRWFTEPFRDRSPDRVDDVVQVFLRTDSAAHAAACRALGALDARDVLPRVSAPTLSVTGEQDYATPPAMGRYAADHVRDGHHVVLENLRHLSLVEQPDLAELVLTHLEGR